MIPSIVIVIHLPKYIVFNVTLIYNNSSCNDRSMDSWTFIWVWEPVYHAGCMMCMMCPFPCIFLVLHTLLSFALFSSSSFVCSMTITSDISHIPVIDFSLFHTDIDACAKQILDAAENVGFFYLRNFGLNRNEVQEMFALASLKSTSCQPPNDDPFICRAKSSLNDPRKKSCSMPLPKITLDIRVCAKKRKKRIRGGGKCT